MKTAKKLLSNIDSPPFWLQYAVEDGVFDVRLLDNDSVWGAAQILMDSDLLSESSTSEDVEEYLGGTIGAYPKGIYAQCVPT